VDSFVLFFFWAISVVGGAMFVVESKIFGYLKNYFLGYKENKMDIEIKIKGLIPEGKINKFFLDLTSCYQCSGSHAGWIFAALIFTTTGMFSFWTALTFSVMAAFAGGYLGLIGVALLNYLDGAKSSSNNTNQST